ncbi:MAG: hypothetical protein MJ053_04135 [Elusimicrobiaceae bacterium]|nr:hypothetical protein [Elusimicrobiaceae bacterium]
MKKWFFCLLSCLLPLATPAQTVGHITARTTRMSPQTLLQRFRLKPGENFSPERYEKAQDELHKLRVFKKLDFSHTTQNDRVYIHIDAQDGYYLFPLAFVTGGSKNAAGVSLTAGNLFKQGEQIFLFGGGSKDGLTARLGTAAGNHFITAAYTQLRFDQNFYAGDWTNVYSVFSTTDEKDHRHEILRSVRGRQDEISLFYNYRFSHPGRFFISPIYNRVEYAQHQLDSGNHHQLLFGVEFSEDIRPGMNMGALAGYGLTDKQKSLQDLPRARFGYSRSLSYAAGGRWSGSDYNVSKILWSSAFLMELPSRHLFMMQTKIQNAFEASFSDQITSTEVLSGAGKYNRQFRGKRAAGVGLSFSYYLLRNQTGLLSLAPFYELSYTRTVDRYRPHSGAGVNVFYRLWRFPLPVGLNYTHNLQDGSHQVGFAIGGAF